MRTVIALVTFLITFVFLSVPGHANDPESAMAVLLNQNVELTSGTLMIFSVANLGSAPDASDSMANCDNLQGFIRFIGTAALSGHEENGEKTLNLLHQRSFNLSPGEVLPLQFLQAFETTETVIVETVVPTHAKHCLAPSSATIFNRSGELVAIVPQAERGSPIRKRATRRIMGNISCCACAPVCGCGVCND